MERHGSIFLGVLLVGLGGLFMLEALDVWPADVATWPGILIVIGVAIFLDQAVRDRRVSWFAPGLLIGLGGYFLLRDADIVDSDFLIPGILIVVGVFVLTGATRRRNGTPALISVPLDGARRGRVRIDHGGGELRIGSLAAGSLEFCVGSGVIEQRVRRSGDQLDVSLRQTPGSWAKSLGRNFGVDLTPTVPLDLELNTGATDTRIDLSDLQVEELRLKTGASSTSVVSPRRGQTRAAVDAGAASVTFVVPDGVAARITADTGLADVSVDTRRFPRSGDVYESPDYAVAIDRLELRIKGGVASFTVS